MIQHRSPINLLKGLNKAVYAHHPDKPLRASLNAPLSFDASMQQLLLLLQGHTLYIMPQEIRADGVAMLNYLTEHALEVLDCTPSQLGLLIEAGLLKEGQAKPALFLVAGEAVSVQMWQTLARPQGSKFFNIYGPTECTVDATAALIKDETAMPTIGRPLANTRVYILNERQQLVGVGEVGELYLGGVGLARGYLNRPDLTAERFLPDPFSTEGGARIYRTGDRARYLADGNLIYVGRTDQQVKLRGMRVELGEIEAALCAHPLVQTCAVLATGAASADRRLVAYLCAAAGGDVSASEVRAYLSARLPAYMLPARFVWLAELPLTASGKIDRQALARNEEEGDTGGEGYVAPRTEMEELVAGIWADVLQAGRVGGVDNFFEVGGHSLSATQVMSRVREATQLELPLRLLFEGPTVAQLSEAISHEQRREAMLPVPPPMLPVPRRPQMLASFAQQRLWFLDQLVPGNPFYNIPGTLRLKGALDVALLERVFNEIIRRHESLRTAFAAVEGQPRQVLSPTVKLPLVVTDLSALSGDEQAAEIRRLAHAEAVAPFDLARVPLVRAQLLRLSEQEHMLLLTMHHIVSDGWSVGVFLHEAATIYRAFAGGHTSPLPELPVQYADFAQWQQEWFRAAVLERQLRYWKQQLTGVTPLELPTDHTRPPIQSYRGARLDVALPKELLQRIKELSKREGVTVYMTLLAAFQVLLGRYANQREVTIGSPIANRNWLETEGLIGFFVNMLVLRGNLDANPSFRELLRRTRESVLEAFAHQDLPFEKLVEELQPERRMDAHPLFQVMFALQNAPLPDADFGAVEASELDFTAVATRFDLEFHLYEKNERLTGFLLYSLDLFDHDRMLRLAEHYQLLLEQLVEDAEARVWEVNFLSKEEYRRAVYDWNATATEYPAHLCIHQLFEAQVSRTPHAIALYFDGQQLTYAELNARANQLARHLQTLGVGVESCVALLMHRSIELVVALLAILKAGAAYLPLDPELPEQRLAFMLSDAAAQLLITQARFATSVAAYHLPVVVADAERSGWTRYATANVASPVSAANACYVIYTSGSTGQPKGVVNLHTSLVNRLGWMQRTYPLAAADCVLQKTPVTFDVSGWEFFWPLMVGARLVVAMPGGHRDAAYLVQTIQAQAVTTLHFVPSMLEVFLHAAGVEHCQSLRRVICSGEALTVKLQARFFARLGAAALENLYGPTEAAIDVTSWSCARAGAPREVPIGHPIANTQVYVLDEGHRPVAVGVVGELYLGGVGLARGYLKRPDLTAERFVPDPFSTAGGAQTLPHRRPGAISGGRHAPVRRAHRPAGQVARHAR